MDVDFGGGFGGGGEWRFNLASYLTAVAVIVRSEGWLSKSKAKAEERIETATANRAWAYLEEPRGGKDREEWEKWHREVPITEDDKAVSEKALDYARDELSAKVTRSDYEHNLYVATIQETVNARLSGIAASLIPYYLREVERRVIRDAELRRVQDSKHIGEIGKRYYLNVEVAKVFTVGEFSQWGPSFLHKMVTPEGNLVIWFASSEAEKLTPGQKYDVKATVKKHETRDDIKQTTVNRVTVVTAEEVAEAAAKATRKETRAKKVVVA